MSYTAGEKQMYVDEVEKSAIWFKRKFDALSVAINTRYTTMARGFIPEMDGITDAYNEVIRARKSLAEAEEAAMAVTYKSRVEGAVHRGFTQ